MPRLCAMALVATIVAMAACGHSTPLAPSEPATAAVTNVRYERVKPIVGDAGAQVVVSIWYALAPGDPYNRTSARLCVLEASGPATFVCRSPRFEFIPVDREWSASVSDPAVSSLPVARDLYLNFTRIRVETYANGAESGVFRIDESGHVS
ncbi:MAG: hypothetical protein AB7I50_11050 [Vicinamibacterales bacterium]